MPFSLDRADGSFEVVQCFGQSSLTLRGCVLGGLRAGSEATVGVFAYNNSVCSLYDCTLELLQDHCIYVGNNACVRLHSCVLRECALGLMIEHSGAAMVRGSRLESLTKGALSIGRQVQHCFGVNPLLLVRLFMRAC